MKDARDAKPLTKAQKVTQAKFFMGKAKDQKGKIRALLAQNRLRDAQGAADQCFIYAKEGLAMMAGDSSRANYKLHVGLEDILHFYLGENNRLGPGTLEELAALDV